MIKLGFMTFVLPEWEIEKIVKFAKKVGYDGVEIRVDAGHKHEISSQSSADTREYVKKLFADEGLEIPCVATSVQFASADPAIRQENIVTAKANLNLAADLGAKVVRTFAGGGIPKLTDEAAEYVAACYDEVGDYAKSLGVCPMLECGHDIIKGADEADNVIKRVKTSNFGVLWNHSTMDDKTFNTLKPRLRHFHVHEEVLSPDNDNILHLAKLIKTIDYDGYISLEIIKGHNLPLDVLTETASRLKGFIARA
ncbi:TIM barrel protein [Candidatus Poribacteria bacterium]|nr:TIM barrel protein [Candidatus Poribacteria bacterium]